MKLRYVFPFAVSLTISSAIVAIPTAVQAEIFQESTPDGCCTYTFETCDARPTHPRPECRAGRKQLNMEANCVAVGCIGEPEVCTPLIATGSVPEVANGIDDDCDFFVDDEQCDGVDNDNDGMIDEDLGSCLLKILFVPMCWQGTQSEFLATAATQFATFQNGIGLVCTDNFTATFADVTTTNLECPTCAGDCGIDGVRNAIGPVIGGHNVADFDVIAMLTDSNPCGLIAGCSDTNQFIWLETEQNAVLAHELGHILGLHDEYCSLNAGSLCPNCNLGSTAAPCGPEGTQTCVPPPNFLGSDLGCDPNVDGCCDDCSTDNLCGDIRACCLGNRSFGSGRCTMSYADAPEPRAYCDRCEAFLKNPTNPRSTLNPDGQAPMDCAFSHIGSQPVASVQYDMDEQGRLSIRNSSIGVGRHGLGTPGTVGEYGIQLTTVSGTVLYTENFYLSFGYTDPVLGGVDYSALHFDRRARGFRAPLPSLIPIDTPLRVLAFRNGTQTFQSTTNGQPPIADAGPDRIIECMNPASTAVLLNGMGSTDPDGDTLKYYWSGTSLSVAFDDPTLATPVAMLPLGSTSVELLVNDGLMSSPPDTTVLTVVDSTPPAITLSATPSILGPPNHKLNDIVVTVDVTDACDSNPTFVLTSITSNEPDPINGNKKQSSDIVGAELGTPDVNFKLRTERLGTGNGRVYTITYTATDSTGNSSQASVLVTVPH